LIQTGDGTFTLYLGSIWRVGSRLTGEHGSLRIRLDLNAVDEALALTLLKGLKFQSDIEDRSSHE
jgi:hypothetical protein